VVLATVAGAFAGAFTEQQYQFLFSKFMTQHNKKYTHDQFFYRYTVFKSNLDIIHEHNTNSGASWTMGVNEFADETRDEFKVRLGYRHVENGYIRSKNTLQTLNQVHVAANTSLDWRTKGVVNPIKNQGQCGSCWAFSATASVESVHAIKTGKLVSLSEQQLVDCSDSFGNQGCNGGLMDQAFEYLIKNGGQCTEASYPYQGVDGTCQTCTPVAEIKGYTDVTAGNEAAIMPALNINPISIAIEADQNGFQFYSGGVFSGVCGTNLDHGVNLVGYGTDAGKNYWILRNSWGTSWGEEGYMCIIRGKDECGLDQVPSYPISS
jgi:C1A family cysteine protease